MVIINSSELKQLVKKLKDLTYSECTLNHKTHEESVRKIITKAGFTEVSLRINKNIGFYFISQPNGTQNPPDFRVYHDDEYINLECKSKKTGYKPMWNSSIPSKDTIYIFTNQKDNKTLIIDGQNIITHKLDKLLNDYKNETKLLQNKHNDILSKLSEVDNPYKIGVYARNMFVQNKHFN